MSSNSQDKISENFLDEWLAEQNFPANVPSKMKVLTYLGFLGLGSDKSHKLHPKKARGAPRKEITKNMLRANKYLSGKEALIKMGYRNPTNKDVIEYLIQAANILYDNKYISKEDRDLFTSVQPKTIQNSIAKGLKKLEKFSKK